MNRRMKFLRHVFPTFSLMLMITGCAGPHYRLNPDTPAKMRQITTVVLPAPEVKMHEVPTGGVVEQRSDWSEQAGERLRSAIEARLNSTKLTVVRPAAKIQPESELREVFDLFGVVGGAVVAHTYNAATAFPAKKTNFDYSLGPLAHSLENPPADGMILVQGAGSVTSSGRVAVAVVGALMGMAVPTGGTLLQAALIDREGTILWYNYVSSSFSADLREPQKVRGVVETLFEGFPEKAP